MQTTVHAATVRIVEDAYFGMPTTLTPAPITPVGALITEFTAYTGPYPYLLHRFCVSVTGSYSGTLLSPDVANGLYFLRGAFSPNTATPSTPLGNFFAFRQSNSNTEVADVTLTAGQLYSALLIFSNGTSAVDFSLSGPGEIQVDTQVQCGPPIPAPAPITIGLRNIRAVSETGSSTNFSVSLTRGAPSANVVLPILAALPGEVSPSADSLTFTPSGPKTQVVFVSGVDDLVVDGDRQVRITVGPAQTSDAIYGSALHSVATSFEFLNRDNDIALPAVPVSGSASGAKIDLTNTGNSLVSSLRGSAIDCTGTVRRLPAGLLSQDLPRLGILSLSTQGLQEALVAAGLPSACDARVELFPIGGEVLAQPLVSSAGNTWNASYSDRLGASILPGSAKGDQFLLSVTNRSAETRDVVGTVYAQDGAVIGAAETVLERALRPQSIADFDASRLQRVLGVGPWTGRPWLKLADNENFSVQNTVFSVGASVIPMNGGPASKAVNYILPPGDGNGTSFARIYNLESFPAQFSATMFASGGATLGSFEIMTTDANAVRVLSSSDIATAIGTTWIGPARLVVNADMTQFGLIGLVRDDGALIEITSVIKDGTITHLPDASRGADIELVITNTAPQAAAISATLTDAAGATLGSADFSLGTLAPYASQTLRRADLVGLGRAVNWTGLATLRIASDVEGIESLVLLRHADSAAITNLSARPRR